MQTAKEKEKVQLLDEIGSIYHEKLQNPQKATAAYLEALEVAPEDHQLLQKILDLYTETKQWKKVVETIERFVALESDPIRKGAYHHAAATICRDELKCARRSGRLLQPRARQLLLESREAHRADAAARAEVVRSDRQGADDEARLEGSGARVPRHDQAHAEGQANPMFHKLQVGLFDGLGEIYRSRLKHYQSATQAFEIAQQMDPKNEMRGDGTDRAEILAELYLVAGPDYTDKAVEQHMRMLRNEPFKYDSYKALRKIYIRWRRRRSSRRRSGGANRPRPIERMTTIA